MGLIGGVGISMDTICVDTLEQSTGGSVALASLGLGFWCRVGNDIVLDRVLAQGQGANRFVGVAHLLSQGLAQHGRHRVDFLFCITSSNMASLGVSGTCGSGDPIHGSADDSTFHPFHGTVLATRDGRIVSQ